MQKQKIVCDNCSKEQFQDKTQKWESINMDGNVKDFCSKKCSSKFVKKLYGDRKKAKKIYLKEEKKMKKKLSKHVIEELDEQEIEDEDDEDIEEEDPIAAPISTKKKIVKKKEEVRWVIKEYPIEYKPAVIDTLTDEAYVCDNLSEAKWKLKMLQTVEELKEAIG